MHVKRNLLVIVSALFFALTMGIGPAFSATPVMNCAGIKNLSFTDIAFGKTIKIDTAQLVSGTFSNLIGIPEVCYVHGTIWPETDFMVVLPTAGNGNLYYVGGGGVDGSLMQNMMSMPLGLNLGYTTAATNGGHNSKLGILGVFMDASFGYNPPDNSNPNYEQKKIDFAYRAAHEGTAVAKEIIKAYYGSAYPKYSYFVGCSNGGRNGMMEAQRYPEDFDGYVIGAPQMNFWGAPLRGVWASQAQLGFAALGFDPLLYGATNLQIQADQLKRVSNYIYNKCDALDGLKDGLINDPRKCSFDPTTEFNRWPYACEWYGTYPCFTAAQRKGLKKIYDGPKTSSGTQLFFGTPPGSEAVGIGPLQGQMNAITEEMFGIDVLPAFSLWTLFVTPVVAGTCGDSIGCAFTQYVAFDPAPGPDWDFRTFNFDTDPQRELATGYYDLVNATNPDLSRLKNRGGKIIHYHGTADAVATTYVSYDYYQKVLNKLGDAATKSFYKFYPVPGMAHCSTGVGCYTNELPFFNAIVNWVEKGIEPNKIIGTRPVNSDMGWTVQRTRPLCPYPTVEKYKGSGSIEDAANFTCQ